MRLFGEKSAEITCVLLDVTMPGMSGKEVFKQIREIRESAAVNSTKFWTGRARTSLRQRP